MAFGGRLDRQPVRKIRDRYEHQTILIPVDLAVSMIAINQEVSYLVRLLRSILKALNDNSLTTRKTP